ncbi:MAG: hypothetical protein NC420_09260 [Eubacterium sp.]|nr:hypothetical protein [Eubacterium sp.]MCM1214519.1 hypothetical protein [Lachnospiraceae bacterium]MCM1303563.1 hypothetical protein [Butyrivibrio sp.]MCM1343287.1 hypothetical protein [Muribaculaceae bacterium]MCM1238398.1 hypothetical protein [Lachnospiraceae bacterium]
MKGSDGKIMALCDTEEEYARLMTEFLKRHRDLPWELHTYTSVEELLAGEQHCPVTMLVVAESAYTEEMQKLQPGRTVVLNESGVLRWKELPSVDKYQQAEEVLRYLLAVYMEIADVQLPRLKKSSKAVFIGNYSPVRRSMQTSFALTMSQLLAQEHRTLYLNFEHYAGIAELLPDAQTFDLADLLYFLNAEQDKFRLRIRTMLRHKGNLDYIPPMKSGQNLLTVTPAEWLGLLQKIEELGEYEYVILDLSESMQGLFDILRICSHIFTLVREDRVARSKLLQYEQILSLYEYEDLLDRTRRVSLSHIRKLPEELEQYTKGDLADMVKELLKTL